MGDAEKNHAGFTLIELSIVLVVIGLIVGGILVGADLIRSAGERAQITQIEKFNQAANAFYEKYGCLPGDLSASLATQFGFVSRPGSRGLGDCNGLIEGYDPSLSAMYNASLKGEPLLFWEDLASARMIDGTFNTATAVDASPFGTTINTFSFENPNLYLPPAKIGNSNYVLASSGGLGADGYYTQTGNALNYFQILVPQYINGGQGYCQTCAGALTVKQAYDIDQKIDDGMPTTGRVEADFLGAPVGGQGTAWSTNASSPSPTTCFDTTSKQYSITQNGGAGVNCGLSIQMQAGDR